MTAAPDTIPPPQALPKAPPAYWLEPKHAFTCGHAREQIMAEDGTLTRFRCGDCLHRWLRFSEHR